MGRCCQILIPLLLLATTVSTLRVYPHQLVYFNEVSGGPENGYRHLLGSNFDWGQDLLLVKRWITKKEIPLDQVIMPGYSTESKKCWKWIILPLSKLSRFDNEVVSVEFNLDTSERIGYVMLARLIDKTPTKTEILK